MTVKMRVVANPKHRQQQSQELTLALTQIPTSNFTLFQLLLSSSPQPSTNVSITPNPNHDPNANTLDILYLLSSAKL